jgi:LysM repeat protein
MNMQRRIVMALLGLCLLLSTTISNAQDAGNLLRDGGFEGTYTSRGRSDFNIPADWNVWVATAPRTESWMNLEPVAFPHNGPGPNPQSGARAMNFNRGFATFTVAIYQQVNVAAGSNVIGSAFGYLRTCNIAPGFDNCGSAVESGAFTRVGIDPTGGTDPNSPSIIWSNNALPHDRWEQMTVNATATAGTITFFIYGTQRWPSSLNNLYFDTATLTGGGTGGAVAVGPGTAAPPPPTPVPQTVPFVVAQGAAEDGSISHIVQPGDTIDSIAFAYGVSRQEILTLNNIRDARIIQVGQELIIRAPEGEETEEEPTTVAAASPTPRPAASTPVPATSEEPAAQEAAVTEEAAPEPTAQPTVPPLDIASLPTAPVRSATTGDVIPAADPASQNGQVCALLFDDLNQNRIQEAGEAALAEGSIILVQGGTSVAEYTTDGSEPFCFAELPAGDYDASIAPPAGYGLTTADQLRLRITGGANINIISGAAEGVAAPVLPADTGADAPVVEDAAPPAPTNPIMDNLGLIALGLAGLAAVVGLGLTFVLRRR